MYYLCPIQSLRTPDQWVHSSNYKASDFNNTEFDHIEIFLNIDSSICYYSELQNKRPGTPILFDAPMHPGRGLLGTF